MGDAGEGLVDAESRIQERQEEIARERAERAKPPLPNPVLARELESLRLASSELQRQLERTTDERRRASINDALAEINRRLEAGR